MHLILGIGNPGREYDGTRHNCGFMAVDELHRRHGSPPWRRRWQAEVCDVRPPGVDGPVLLIKPTTYVNLSGEAAQGALAFHHLTPDRLLVMVDDLNLALGDLRLRAEGSAGGHNGLKDIEARIGRSYARLRMGIGRSGGEGDQIGFVLARFAPAERDDAQAMITKAADAAEAWLGGGCATACRFNGPLRLPPARPPNQIRSVPPPASGAPLASDPGAA